MIDFSTTLFHGILICIPFSIFALVSFWLHPRLWLHSLPEDIAQRAAPKTDKEKKLTTYLLLPLFLLILPGLSIASVWYVSEATLTDLSFIGIFIHLYFTWIIVHAWDFLIIDGVSMLLIDSQRPPIPGTAGARGWKDYGFHFRSFIRASIMSVLFVVPAAAILSFIL